MKGSFHHRAMPNEGIGTFEENGFRVSVLSWFLALFVVLGGCVTAHQVSSGGFYIETLSSSRVSLSNIDARRKADVLIVSGEVSRRNAAFSGIGHVDVAVVSPDGTVLCQGNGHYTPKILPKTPGARKHRPAQFNLHLSCKPIPGSTVRVAYHATPEHNEPFPDFQENYAVPEHHDHGG